MTSFPLRASSRPSLTSLPISKPVKDAYRRVVASLFSDEAMAYQRRFGFRAGSLRMAVGVVDHGRRCLERCLIHRGPLGQTPDVMVINSAWGLGKAVVEGSTDADMFVVGKISPFTLLVEAIVETRRR